MVRLGWEMRSTYSSLMSGRAGDQISRVGKVLVYFRPVITCFFLNNFSKLWTRSLMSCTTFYLDLSVGSYTVAWQVENAEGVETGGGAAALTRWSSSRGPLTGTTLGPDERGGGIIKGVSSSVIDQ